MIRRFVIAMVAMLMGTAPAHAALMSFNFGTSGQTSGTVTYDTTLGAKANGFQPIAVSFTNLFLLGTPIAGTFFANGAASDNGTSQTVALNGFFKSPFSASGDFSSVYALTFQGSEGSLFSGNQLVNAGALISHFVSGTVNPTSDTTVTFGVSSVPEPLSWVLMVVGVAVIGVGLRRRTEDRGVAIAA